ncbi:MAG: alpha/beta hydrolase [Acidobacteriota bacterium]
MRSRGKALTAAAFAAGLTYQVLAAQQPPPGVGPNGEYGGLVARFADVNGVRTRYYEEGAGEPIILVHGSGFHGTASANTWVPVIGHLAKRLHVFAIDKLASGMTDNPKSDDDLNIRGEMEHIVSFIKTKNLGKVHLVGQSRGGGLVFLLAVNHPELVKTLVIVDSATAAPGAGDDRANRRRNLFEHCPEEPWTAQWPCRQAAQSYNRAQVTPEFVAAGVYMGSQPKAQETERRMTREVSRKGALLGAQMNHDAYRRIDVEGVLQMPVLLYWGKNDPSVLPIQAEALFNIIAETNPHARLLYTNRGGHFHYREHPEEFAHTVASFIEYWNGPGAKELVAPTR